MKAKLIINRTDEYANRLRKINIFINNVKVYNIKNGEEKEIELDVGKHEVYAKIDWCKTKPFSVELKKDEEIELELGSNLNVLNPFKTVYYTFFKTSEYLFLKPIL